MHTHIYIIILILCYYYYYYIYYCRHYIVLNTDRKEFGGQERINESIKHFPQKLEWNGRPYFIQVRIYY